jgi:hypothetical protein
MISQIDYYNFVQILQIERVKNADDVCMPFVERTGAAVTTLYLTIFLRGRSATCSEKEKKLVLSNCHEKNCSSKIAQKIRIW